MKSHLLLVTSLLLLPLISARAQWRADHPQPMISVTGSSEIKVAPDVVDLNVGVETCDESLEAAKRKNDDSVAGALDFLKHDGIPDKYVQTDYLVIEPVYDPNAGVDPRTGIPRPGFDNHGAIAKPVYYLVRKNISITVTNLASFDPIVTGLLGKGVNTIQGITFRTTELRKYKDQARSMAIRAAREKAVAAAQDLGVVIGKPYDVSINEGGGWYNSYGGGGGGGGLQNSFQNAGGAGENAGTFAAGQISISANVSVSFLIQ